MTDFGLDRNIVNDAALTEQLRHQGLELGFTDEELARLLATVRQRLLQPRSPDRPPEGLPTGDRGL